MKTILVPIDFSPASQNSTNYAAEVALLAKAKIILLNVYSVPVPVADVPIPIVPLEEIEQKCLAELKVRQSQLQIKYPQLHVEVQTRAGFVTDEILSAIKEYHADLVVMGVLGNGKTSAIFGSNTASVIKKATCPVMAIPPDLTFSVPAKIALACDYSATVPEKVTDALKAIIKLFGAKLLIFDVLKPAELVTYQKALAEINLETSLSDIEHSMYYPSGTDLMETTQDFIDRNNVDMLVMIPHNYNFVQQLFHKSNTRKLALHTKTPLLSIHE